MIKVTDLFIGFENKITTVNYLLNVSLPEKYIGHPDSGYYSD
ncbi:hypothetical protein SAMN05444362_11848 [Dysgonomonas macrotermitis]|uniref:Uncharacterized protein n=1 Tax=Dysgonomonas macrotermitis TaxID=1346286 RepID=A0A1M5I685_9BACT|nr:hypothetical protein SAMN05444362_11848 [Dysgonomonas macrotermitis]